ncbi:riboflavin kinase [Klosneuvirus KNV1]|uniref:riboflavin kinase n=1 Tax=Klosneuvirus KNV1 TaxID=1977640 RepID=A0A1V0SJE1_9VIRU|nr:riboflavin kinase [Klosneuvirus KNV1]
MSFPYLTNGTVIHGYKRGSKELGFPTANLDIEIPELDDGVYYGYAILNDEPKEKMVMSIGSNPQYGNNHRSYEVHILKKYDEDFYGENLTIIIIGKIREMMKFDSLDALIIAINQDIDYANKMLAL